MNSKSNTAIKYVGSAMAVGGALMLGGSMISSGRSLKKRAKKTANKALDAIDSALTNVQNMVK